jgi:thiosulfate dehydrogenase
MRKIFLYILTGIILVILLVYACRFDNTAIDKQEETGDQLWNAPDTSIIPHNTTGDMIRYGRRLVVNTSFYFGPNGILNPIANGLNCQSCHLDAGTKPFGNNFGSVASMYPKFRERSGTIESIEKKINDCFERSMNGKSLDSLSKEMRSMVAYMKWLGSNVKKGTSAKGSGLVKLPYLDRAADTANGRQVFALKCTSCHGVHGEGLLDHSQRLYQYPPLWGRHSYNNGAGIYRISKFAAFVKTNMPFGATYDNPLLSDEEAWDVAAYVNSQSRPSRNFNADWPNLETKPVDHPYGPYSDRFTEQQHKYGPYKAMEKKLQ